MSFREPATPPPVGFRKPIPIRVKLRAALRAAGLNPDLPIEWDHEPAVQLRVYDTAIGDTIPGCNDDRYIVPRQKDEHRIKTTKRDIPEIAKTKRLSATQEAARARMLLKDEGVVMVKPTSRWPKRRFDGQRRPPAPVDDIERADGGD